MRRRLKKKYKIKSKSFDIVIGNLKHDIKATTQKTKQFTERNKHYCNRENIMFVNNQRQFNGSLEKSIETWA